jgi:hypothetical protein
MEKNTLWEENIKFILNTQREGVWKVFAGPE